MRYHLLLSIALLSGLSFVAGCGKSKPPAASPTPPPAAPDGPDVSNVALEAEPGTKVLALAVYGMHCEGCAQSVTDQTSELPGVKHVRVSLDHKMAWFQVDDESETSAEDLVAAINELEGKKAMLPEEQGPITEPETDSP